MNDCDPVWRSPLSQPKYHCAGDYKLSDFNFQHFLLAISLLSYIEAYCVLFLAGDFVSFNLYFDIRGNFKLEYCHQQVKNGARWTTERRYVLLLNV